MILIDIDYYSKKFGSIYFNCIAGYCTWAFIKNLGNTSSQNIIMRLKSSLLMELIESVFVIGWEEPTSIKLSYMIDFSIKLIINPLFPTAPHVYRSINYRNIKRYQAIFTVFGTFYHQGAAYQLPSLSEVQTRLLLLHSCFSSCDSIWSDLPAVEPGTPRLSGADISAIFRAISVKQCHSSLNGTAVGTQLSSWLEDDFTAGYPQQSPPSWILEPAKFCL